MAGQLDDAAKQILGTLLEDFNDRGLTVADLNSGYEGPKIESLATAVCNVEDITTVDFEVAFSDLEKAKLIKTGPLYVPDANAFGDNIVFVGILSKREYVYLTEKGYKEARKKPNRPLKVQKVVNNLTITGGNFNQLQLAQGETVRQTLNIATSSDSEIAGKLIEIMESHGVNATSEKREDIEKAIVEANKGNAGAAKDVLAKAFGATWGVAKGVVIPIVTEIIKKHLGM